MVSHIWVPDHTGTGNSGRRGALLGRRGMWRLEAAVAASHSQQLKAALADCEQAVVALPQSAALRLNLGVAYERRARSAPKEMACE